MSITSTEQTAYPEEPRDFASVAKGVPTLSNGVFVENTRFSDLFAAEPRFAQQIWEDTRTQILETDFDPRRAYLEGFARGVAARDRRVHATQAEANSDQSVDGSFDIPLQPGESTLQSPTEPDAGVLMQLGATSLFLDATRAYYQSTLQS